MWGTFLLQETRIPLVHTCAGVTKMNEAAHLLSCRNRVSHFPTVDGAAIQRCVVQTNEDSTESGGLCGAAAMKPTSGVTLSQSPGPLRMSGSHFTFPEVRQSVKLFPRLLPSSSNRPHFHKAENSDPPSRNRCHSQRGLLSTEISRCCLKSLRPKMTLLRLPGLN